MQQDDVDVVVVGAGLAGLTLAHRLTSAGRTVCVLEARSRMGGRIVGFEVGSRSVQLGGRWTGPGQTAVKSLAAEFGISTRANRTFDDAHSQTHDSSEAFAQAVREIDRAAKSVSLEAPWQAPDAIRLDAQTLKTWLERCFSVDIADDIGALLTGFFPESQDVSCLHALFYLHSNGGLASILGMDGPAHDSELFVGGAHALIEQLGARYADHVILGRTAYKVSQDADGVEVVADEGRYRGRQCVVAMPPVLAGRLSYDPPLSNARDYLTQRMPIRGKIAFALLYDEAFWRKESQSTLIHNEFFSAWDEGGSETPYSLHGLVTIPWSRELGGLPMDQRKAAITEKLANTLGEKTQSPVNYFDVDWAAEPWSRGCNSFMTTGVWTVWGHALREAQGRVHFAGAEMSPQFYGQMDGAVRSAETVATEIIKRLGM